MSKWAGLDLDMAGDSSNKVIKNFRFEAFTGTDRPSQNPYDANYHRGYLFYDATAHNLMFGRDSKPNVSEGFYAIADTTSKQNLSNKILLSVEIDSLLGAASDAIVNTLGAATDAENQLATVAAINTALGGYDNYGYWNLKTDGVQRKQINSNDLVDFVGGTNISVAYSAGGVVTINGDYTYTHPTGFSDVPATALTDLAVISQVNVNDEGHVTGVVTRDMPSATITDGQGLTWTHDTVNNILTGDVHLTPFTTDDLEEGASNLYFSNELVDDRVAQLLNAGTGISLTYSDATNTLTISTDASAISYWTKIGDDLYYSDGNVYVNGENFFLDADHIRTSDEEMILRYDATTAIGAGVISGLRITKYDGTNDLLFGAGSDGWFKIGEPGSEQIVATRDTNANIVDGNLLILNETTNQLEDAGVAPGDIVTPGDNIYLTGLSFDTGTGVLTASMNNASNITEDLDGRYALQSSLHDAVTLTSDDTDILSLSAQALTFVSTNIAKLDRVENNFTGIVDAADFKLDNSLLDLTFLNESNVIAGNNGKVAAIESGSVVWKDLMELPGNGGMKYKVISTATASGTILQTEHTLGTDVTVKFMSVTTNGWEEVYGVDYKVHDGGDAGFATGDIEWNSDLSFAGKIFIMKAENLS